MPVKKNKRKKTGKKIDRKIKKEIKEAVEKIPQMIAEDRYNTGKSIKSPDPVHNYSNREYKWKQIIMWFGVIILSGTVIFMWFLNTNATFFDINKNLSKSEEAKILNERSQGIKEVLSDVQLRQKLESLQIEKVKVNPAVTNTAQFESLIQSINSLTNQQTSTTSSSTNNSIIAP